MNTLDTLVQETLRRIEASGGKAWIAPDSPDERLVIKDRLFGVVGQHLNNTRVVA